MTAIIEVDFNQILKPEDRQRLVDEFFLQHEDFIDGMKYTEEEE